MWTISIDSLPPSLNQWYSGVHWSKRTKTKEEWSWKFLAATKEAKLPDKIAHIQTVHVTQFCKGIVRDADNAVVAAKLFGDFLKAQGIIEDDGPKFIETIVLTTKKGKENRTVILIS